MINSLILDSSALVAVLDRADQWHIEGSRVFGTLKDFKLLTCEAVLTEAWFLLGSKIQARTALLGFADEALSITFSLRDEIRSIQTLVTKYSDVPMSLADACLVRMSEIFNAPVFTFDTDFKIYRRNRSEKIPIIGLE